MALRFLPLFFPNLMHEASLKNSCASRILTFYLTGFYSLITFTFLLSVQVYRSCSLYLVLPGQYYTSLFFNSFSKAEKFASYFPQSQTVASNFIYQKR